MKTRVLCLLGIVAGTALLTALVAPTRAYVEAPMSFGAIVAQSSNIVLMRVEAVDKEKNFIIYRKVQDLKGKHNGEIIKHNIGRGGLRPNEWKPQMDWAEPGKMAVFFYNGGASETCIGNWWYQAYAGGEWWNHSHAEPFLLRSYCGPPEKLSSIVPAMVAGQEVIVPCMVDGNKDDLHNRRAKIQRLKSSLKIQDYNPKRDFVGWGGEDFRRLQGWAGFTHISSLGRVDPEAQALSLVDFDGDGKLDICLIGAGRVVLLQNGGEAFSEHMLPQRHGARAAVWADYNADGKPDLLLATPAGPKLMTNLGGTFRDDSHLLPAEPFYNLTAAAWIDHDGDGRPDILLANGYHGLRLYRNTGDIKMPAAVIPKLGKWHFLGPLDNTSGRGFDATHPAETRIDLQAAYTGKGGEQIAWKEASFNDGTPCDLLNLFKPQHRAWSSIYLYREIEVSAPLDLPVSLGSDDTLSVWLNGKKILAQNTYRAVAADQDHVTLKLKEGKNQLLLKIGQGDGDWAFYFQAAQVQPPVPQGKAFVDISDSVGFGPDGIAANLKGDALSVRDVNGDNRPDILYGAGGGMLLLNTKTQTREQFFIHHKEAGIVFPPGKVGPIFGDLDNDGLPEVIFPAKGTIKVFKNEGNARFKDISESTGDLAKFAGWAASASLGDFDNDGHLDLLVGCLKGPNRFLRNKGDGSFEDATDLVGLGQAIFNSQAVAQVDLNNDGSLDMVFNNEGQDSVVLLGNNGTASKKVPLALNVTGKAGIIGSRVQVSDAQGKLVGAQEISAGEGRGGQQPPLARFALEPGTYRVTLRYSNGQTRTTEVRLDSGPTRRVLDDAAKAE